MKTLFCVMLLLCFFSTLSAQTLLSDGSGDTSFSRMLASSGNDQNWEVLPIHQVLYYQEGVPGIMGRGKASYYSLLSGYVEGKQSKCVVSPQEEGVRRILVQNLPLWWLYRVAYSTDGQFFGRNRILLEVDEPQVFESDKVGREYEDWLRQGNGYCYELVVPHDKTKQLWQLMQQDLKNYFPQYQAQVEIRRRTVLALVRTSH